LNRSALSFCLVFLAVVLLLQVEKLNIHKHFRKIEDALALLLLQVNPEDVMFEMKPEFLECQFDGSKERLYTGYSSGDYPIDVQGWIKQH
jgi:hypothetical protein